MISGHPQAPALRRLARGMVVDGEAFQPVEVRILSSTQSATTLSMVLREGRKREVRRLWQALGHRVLDLQRVRIDGLRLGTLAEGETRPLTDAEVERLKGAVI
jgi:23S rRNA pseudouridine2605 synthase